MILENFAVEKQPSADVNAKISQAPKSNGRSESKGTSFYSKLALLYFLNIADWICTEALLGSGYFFEANPVMRPVLGDFWLTVLIKGVLPLVLICGCALIYRLLGTEQTFMTNLLLYIGIVAYALVNLWHILNFVLLFSVF